MSYGPCLSRAGAATPARCGPYTQPDVSNVPSSHGSSAGSGCSTVLPEGSDEHVLDTALAMDFVDATSGGSSVANVQVRRVPHPEHCNCARCEVGANILAQPLALGEPVCSIPARYAGNCRGGCGRYIALNEGIFKGTPNSIFTCRDCADARIRREDLESRVLVATQRRNTQEQNEILRWLQWGKPGSSLVIDAKAGSGKTTTICQGYVLVTKRNPKTSCLFIAFNRSIVHELKQKGMPSWTAHGIGWRAWVKAHEEWNTAEHGRNIHEPNLHSNDEAEDDDEEDASHTKDETIGQHQGRKYLTSSKTSRIIAELCPPPKDSKKKHGLKKQLGKFVGRLVALAKNHCLGVPGCASAEDVQEWMSLVDHYGFKDLLVDPENKTQTAADIMEDAKDGIKLSQRVLTRSIDLAKKAPSEGGMLDFDDQLYMPLFCGLELTDRRKAPNGYDFLFVDEAQDMNPARIQMVKHLVRKDGATRVIAVGDPLQAIYGFTGAEHEALHALGRAFNASSLPLSITWRCPLSHVELANQVMRRWGRLEGTVQMQPRDGADAGIIRGRWWSWANLSSKEEVTFANFPLSGTRDAAVLCRTNAPLLLLQISSPWHPF